MKRSPKEGLEKIVLSDRKYYIDVLKIIACAMVVMIHAISTVKSSSSNYYQFVMTVDALIRCAVPIFFMVSGMNFLYEDKNISMNKIYGKYIKKLIIVYLSWNLVCVSVEGIIEHHSIRSMLEKYINGYYHLWFIPAIIGIYMITPILRVVVRRDNKEMVEYALIFSLIANFLIPWLSSLGLKDLMLFSSLFHTSIVFGEFVTYFVLGWYLDTYEIKNRILIYIIGMISVVTVCIYQFYTGSILTNPNAMFLRVLYAISVVVFVKHNFIRLDHYNKIIVAVSKLTLGIYVIHPVFIEICNSYANFNIIERWFISLMLSAISIMIIEKLPLLKKIV